jgi:hypothetical protein
MFHVPIEGESDLEVAFENEGRNLKQTPSASFVAEIGSAASLARLSRHGTGWLEQGIRSLELLANGSARFLEQVWVQLT